MNAQTHRLPAVAQVLEAIPLASSTGKFETKAQILAKRPVGATGVLRYIQGSHINLFY